MASDWSSKWYDYTALHTQLIEMLQNFRRIRTAYLFYGLLVIVRLFLCFTYSMRYANICIHCLLLCWSWRLSQIESTYLLANLRLSKTCGSALLLPNRMSTIAQLRCLSCLCLILIFLLVLINSNQTMKSLLSLLLLHAIWGWWLWKKVLKIGYASPWNLDNSRRTLRPRYYEKTWK